MTDPILSTDQTAFRPVRFGASCNLLNTLSKFTHNSKLPAIHLKMSGSLFAAWRSVSVGMWVYCFDTVGESWPMNSRATASDTPADLSRVVAV